MVGGSGPRDAPFVLVGEAPGEVEVAQCQPFVGPAGKLLWHLAASNGLRREDFYTTNVFKVRPPHNEVGWFFLPKAAPGDKVTKLRPEHLHQLDLLMAELEATTAPLILAAGGTALWALTGEKHITKKRGSVYPANPPLHPGALAGRWVMPLIHPSAALRQWDYTVLIASDLAKAKDPSLWMPKSTTRVVHVVKSLNDTLELCHTLQRAEVLSFDIETKPVGKPHMLEVSCIGFATTPQEGWCIPFNAPSGRVHSINNEAEVWAAIGELLSSPVPKVGQNLNYDIEVLARLHHIYTENVWLDTMVAHHVLYPGMPKDLATLASLYTNEPYWKDDGKEWRRVKDYEQFWRYNVTDACVTLAIARVLDGMLQKRGAWPLLERVLKLQFGPLMAATINGYHFDTRAAQTLRPQIVTELKSLQNQLDSMAGRHINCNATAQLQEYLYGDLGLPKQIHRKTGKPTTDEHSLAMLRIKHNHPALGLVLAIRERSKLLSTYVDMPTDPLSGKMHCSYSVAGTKTGRLNSSSTPSRSGGNLQNIPQDKRIRNLFVAPEGWTIAAFDQSQAEARVVAVLSQDSAVLRAFEEKLDVHCINASLIFGKPYEWLFENKKTLPEAKHLRDLGKKAKHAFNYGMGPRLLQMELAKEGIEHSTQECKEILLAVERSSPAVVGWHNSIQAQLRRSRSLTTPLGRECQFLDRWGDGLFRSAYAYIPQSVVGDVTNIGIQRVYDTFGDEVTLLAQVHDESQWLVPTERLDELMPKMAQLMLVEIDFGWTKMTIPIEAKSGPRWGSLAEDHRGDAGL